MYMLNTVIVYVLPTELGAHIVHTLIAPLCEQSKIKTMQLSLYFLQRTVASLLLRWCAIPSFQNAQNRCTFCWRSTDRLSFS